MALHRRVRLQLGSTNNLPETITVRVASRPLHDEDRHRTIRLLDQMIEVTEQLGQVAAPVREDVPMHGPIMGVVFEILQDFVPTKWLLKVLAAGITKFATLPDGLKIVTSSELRLGFETRQLCWPWTSWRFAN